MLVVFGLLEEFGERGVNHLLSSTQSKLSSTQLHSELIFSVGEAPLGSLFFYLSEAFFLILDGCKELLPIVMLLLF